MRKENSPSQRFWIGHCQYQEELLLLVEEAAAPFSQVLKGNQEPNQQYHRLQQPAPLSIGKSLSLNHKQNSYCYRSTV